MDDQVILSKAEDAGGMVNPVVLKGVVEIFLIGPKDEIKHHEIVENLVTTAGDKYYAEKAIANIDPANPSPPTEVTGMKLGTGSTAAAKSGAGAALVTYESGSNNLFDSTFPSTEDLAGDTGWNVVYQVTWAAGDVTESALREVVIVNDAGTDATSSEANTISRVVYSAIDKTASDTLIIVWKHKFLGA
jgi:hypothetical protein